MQDLLVHCLISGSNIKPQNSRQVGWHKDGNIGQWNRMDVHKLIIQGGCQDNLMGKRWSYEQMLLEQLNINGWEIYRHTQREGGRGMRDRGRERESQLLPRTIFTT